MNEDEILFCREADVFLEAEGSIWQRPCYEVGPTRGGSSPGHAPQGSEPKRAPHPLSHQEDRLWKWVGRRCNQGSTGGSTNGCWSSLTTL